MHRHIKAALPAQPYARCSQAANTQLVAKPKAKAGYPATMLALLAAVVAGCSTVSLEPVAAPLISQPEPVIAAPMAAAPLAIEPGRSHPLRLVLDYADQLRVMPPRQLANEVARLGSSAMPSDQLRLALALMQARPIVEPAIGRQNGEAVPAKSSQEMLLRAQDLVQQVLQGSDRSAEEESLRGFARLLMARLSEQRRLEDLLDRQAQQLRDSQRRLDQANEKLEAIKEIERSLTRRSTNNQAPASTRPRLNQP